MRMCGARHSAHSASDPATPKLPSQTSQVDARRSVMQSIEGGAPGGRSRAVPVWGPPIALPGGRAVHHADEPPALWRVDAASELLAPVRTCEHYLLDSRSECGAWSPRAPPGPTVMPCRRRVYVKVSVVTQLRRDSRDRRGRWRSFWGSTVAAVLLTGIAACLLVALAARGPAWTVATVAGMTATAIGLLTWQFIRARSFQRSTASLWVTALAVALGAPALLALGGRVLIPASAGMPAVAIAFWGSFAIAIACQVDRAYRASTSTSARRATQVGAAIAIAISALGGVVVPLKALSSISGRVPSSVEAVLVDCQQSRYPLSDFALTVSIDAEEPAVFVGEDGRANFDLPVYLASGTLEVVALEPSPFAGEKAATEFTQSPGDTFVASIWAVLSLGTSVESEPRGRLMIATVTPSNCT